MKELRRLKLLSFILAIYTVEANKEITNSSTIKGIGSNGKSGSVDHEIFRSVIKKNL